MLTWQPPVMWYAARRERAQQRTHRAISKLLPMGIVQAMRHQEMKSANNRIGEISRISPKSIIM